MLLPIAAFSALPYSRPKFKTPTFKAKQMVEVAKVNYFSGSTNTFDSVSYLSKIRGSIATSQHFKYCCIVLYYNDNVLVVEQTKSEIDCFATYNEAMDRLGSQCKTLEENGWQQFYTENDVNVQGNEKRAYSSNTGMICVVQVISIPMK